MTAELDSRVALITGAASGIGAATAQAMAAAGAKVAVADLDASGADRVVSALRDQGAEAVAVPVDIADEQQVAAAVQQTVDAFGRLDILHNNAAAVGAEQMMADGAIHEIDIAVWQRALSVNLTGCLLCTKHAIPYMLERKAGVIINTASVGGLFGDGARPGYGTSKAGIIGLTRNVATQYGKRGIRCVAIAPGLIMTPAAELMPPVFAEMMLRHQLSPRHGRPEDVAELVVFLASDRAGFLTGITVPVDGGLSVHGPQWADETALVAHA